MVEVKWNVFIFFFHLKKFSLFLCSALCSSSLLSRHKSSYLRCSIEKAVFKKFTTFTGKHLFWSHFYNKVAHLKAYNFIKKRVQYSCFPVNIGAFWRRPILKNICKWQLLLTILKHFICTVLILCLILYV